LLQWTEDIRRSLRKTCSSLLDEVKLNLLGKFHPVYSRYEEDEEEGGAAVFVGFVVTGKRIRRSS
jgi:hypothetical protein